ncbi:hypothetical protein MBLNU459_g6618t1 [Dothideomycetes sp. NU459]
MNDPGTAEPIKEAAQDADGSWIDRDDDKEQAKQEEKKLLEEERDYRDPSRYWFLSTACPLIAGTFGPMASAFNVCALSSSWRVYIPPEGTEEHGTVIDDPKWLIAINAVSLAFALIANGSLLLNMSRRLRFSIAQPITIIGFFLSSALLIADIGAMTDSHTYRIPLSSPAAPANSHALSSAFYYGIMAAAIYFIIGILMSLTVWGAYQDYYSNNFNLSVAQRTLMLQTMSFFTYLLLGALIFSKVEGWSFLEAVYWADVTLLTVGLGDYSPSTHTGRSLLIPFAIGGIVTIGLVIGSIRTLILERGQKKISSRMMEKKRMRAINSVDPRHHRIKINRFKTLRFDETYSTSAKKREQEFHIMRAVQECAERDRKWMALAISTTAAFTLWLVGALIFKIAERNQQWTYFEALYFSYTSLLTIGYGSPTPYSNSGRPFFVLWSLLAVPTLTILISDMGDTVIQAFSNLTIWVGSLTVLPGEAGVTSSAKIALKQFSVGRLNPSEFATQQPPGFEPAEKNSSLPTNGGNPTEQEDTITERIADRLARHLQKEELHEAAQASQIGDTIERDTHFYHFILAREIQRLMRDLNAKPSKRYEWSEWEYFLKLMANDYDTEILSGEILVPKELRLPENEREFNTKREEHRWSWLSRKSPLMGHRTETEWILERLGTCLERELKDSRMVHGKAMKRRPPPVSMDYLIKRVRSNANPNGDVEDSASDNLNDVEASTKLGEQNV